MTARAPRPLDYGRRGRHAARNPGATDHGVTLCYQLRLTYIINNLMLARAALLPGITRLARLRRPSSKDRLITQEQRWSCGDRVPGCAGTLTRRHLRGYQASLVHLRPVAERPDSVVPVGDLEKRCRLERRRAVGGASARDEGDGVAEGPSVDPLICGVLLPLRPFRRGRAVMSRRGEYG
jgi:hypothetical protein